MFPTPKGYISLPDAVDRVSRALHGEPKTIPWCEEDADGAVRLDEAVVRSGREQTVEAIEWMIAELSADRLAAQVGNYELPAGYWTGYGAYTTAHTGCLEPPEMDAGDYAKIAYQPCFIERGAFEERLFQQFNTARPKGKGGNRRTFNDNAIVKKARAIWESSGAESKMAAAREAMHLHPKLYGGRGNVENIAKRIAKQI